MRNLKTPGIICGLVSQPYHSLEYVETLKRPKGRERLCGSYRKVA